MLSLCLRLPPVPTTIGLGGWHRRRRHEEAAWFARRFDLGRGLEGNVYQATVGREAVLACFDQRNESEMVIDPRPLPPLRAMRWTPAEVDRMAERAGHRKHTSLRDLRKGLEGAGDR